MVCDTANSTCPQGTTCRATSVTSNCTTIRCNSTMGVYSVPCTAACQPNTSTLLTSAILQPDGAEIVFKGAVPALHQSVNCSRVFGPASFLAIGGDQAVCRVDMDGLLRVIMPSSATLLPGQSISFSAGLSEVYKWSSVILQAPVILKGCGTMCMAPIAVVSGPAVVADPCPGAQAGSTDVLIDGSLSRDVSYRELANAQWSLAGSWSEVLNAPLQEVVTGALNTLLLQQNAISGIRCVHPSCLGATVSWLLGNSTDSCFIRVFGMLSHR